MHSCFFQLQFLVDWNKLWGGRRRRRRRTGRAACGYGDRLCLAVFRQSCTSEVEGPCFLEAHAFLFCIEKLVLSSVLLGYAAYFQLSGLSFKELHITNWFCYVFPHPNAAAPRCGTPMQSKKNSTPGTRTSLPAIAPTLSQRRRAFCENRGRRIWPASWITRRRALVRWTIRSPFRRAESDFGCCW